MAEVGMQEEGCPLPVIAFLRLPRDFGHLPTPSGLRPPPPNTRLSVELTTLGLVVVFGGGGDLRSGRDRPKNARF